MGDGAPLSIPIDELTANILGGARPRETINGAKAQKDSLRNAFKVMQLTAGLIYPAIFEAATVIWTYVIIGITDDGSIWNYVMAIHCLLPVVMIFIGAYRYDPDTYAVGGFVLSFVALFLDAVGVWYRDTERMPGQQTQMKLDRKNTLLAVQVILMVLSIVYLFVLGFVLARLRAGTKSIFGVVIPALTAEFYVSIVKENVFEALLTCNSADIQRLIDGTPSVPTVVMYEPPGGMTERPRPPAPAPKPAAIRAASAPPPDDTTGLMVSGLAAGAVPAGARARIPPPTDNFF